MFTITRRTKYKTKEDWKNYQNSQGTASCGTFEVGCHVEKMLKDWLRKAIVMGMTWIIDIATGSGLFLSAGLRYSYSKYIVYDVMQFVASRPIFYGPIGSGLSYTNSFTEFPIGAGYIYSFGAFKIEPSFHLLYTFIKTRDFHVQRALNFLSYTSGPGFLVRIETSYMLSETSLLKIGITGHRQFTTGAFTTKGGLYESDILLRLRQMVVLAGGTILTLIAAWASIHFMFGVDMPKTSEAKLIDLQGSALWKNSIEGLRDVCIGLLLIAPVFPGIWHLIRRGKDSQQVTLGWLALASQVLYAVVLSLGYGGFSLWRRHLRRSRQQDALPVAK